MSKNQNISSIGGGGGGGSHKNLRNQKKIDEVKEVIQNRQDLEISKVLEVYDNDVGKTIDAFVTDNGKEALKKWSETKKNKKNNNKNNNAKKTDQENNSNSAPRSNENKSKPSANGKKAKNSSQANANSNSNRLNINDLVASIIDQHTSSNPQSAIVTSSEASFNNSNSNFQPPRSAMNSNGIVATASATNLPLQTPPFYKIDETQQQKITREDQVVHDLKRFTLNNNNNINSNNNNIPQITTTINGHLKLNILGLESSSDNFMSTSSSSSLVSPPSSSASPANARNKEAATSTKSKQPEFNMSVHNPSAKNLLEKPAKDLQVHAAMLTKAASQYEAEAARSQASLNQAFVRLQKLLQQRQAQLVSQLNAAYAQGSSLIKQRQRTASDLKVTLDNAIHLSDRDALELKEKIKHFNGERQMDEELGRTKLFDENFSIDRLYESIGLFGNVNQIKDAYSKERPLNTSGVATGQSENKSAKLNGGSSQQRTMSHGNNARPAAPASAAKVNGNHRASETNGKNSHVLVDSNNNHNNSNLNAGLSGKTSNSSSSRNNTSNNGKSKSDKLNSDGQANDNEGEFIEVKKRQRNKKPQPIAEERKMNGANHRQSNKVI